MTKKWSSSSFYSEGDTSLLSNIRFSDRVPDLFGHPPLCFWGQYPPFEQIPLLDIITKDLLISFHYFYLILSQAVKLIDHLIYFLVRGGDLGSEGVAVGLVLVKVVFPFILLRKG